MIHRITIEAEVARSKDSDQLLREVLQRCGITPTKLFGYISWDDMQEMGVTDFSVSESIATGDIKVRLETK